MLDRLCHGLRMIVWWLSRGEKLTHQPYLQEMAAKQKLQADLAQQNSNRIESIKRLKAGAAAIGTTVEFGPRTTCYK